MEVAVKSENPAPNANAPLPQRIQKQQGPQTGGNEPVEKKPRFSDINPNQNQSGPGGFQRRNNNSNRMNNNRNNNRNNPLQGKQEVNFSNF